MANNTGKPSESAFIKSLESRPKTKVFRLRDAADLYGLNKKKIAVFGLPSDFIVVSNGSMFFAEVKSTQNKTSFSLDCLTPSQKAACLQVSSCGGDYRIYIHNLITDTWYLLTGPEYVTHKKANIKSIKWEQLTCIQM